MKGLRFWWLWGLGVNENGRKWSVPASVEPSEKDNVRGKVRIRSRTGSWTADGGQSTHELLKESSGERISNRNRNCCYSGKVGGSVLGDLVTNFKCSIFNPVWCRCANRPLDRNLKHMLLLAQTHFAQTDPVVQPEVCWKATKGLPRNLLNRLGCPSFFITLARALAPQRSRNAVGLFAGLLSEPSSNYAVRLKSVGLHRVFGQLRSCRQ